MRKIFLENDSKKIILYSIFGGILVLCFDAVLHVIRDPQSTFIEPLLNPSTHELHTPLLFGITLSLLFVILSQRKTIQDQHAQVENIFNNVIPICMTNLNYEIITANDAYWSIWGRVEKSPIKCHEHRPGKFCHTKECALTRVVNGAEKYSCESQININGENKNFLVTVTPYVDSQKKTVGIIESFEDITERQKLEEENEHLISDLQESLKKVKLLSGLLPICASCKSIKDDKGRWSKVETYIANHSEATCSHGICPECAERLYPEIYTSIKRERPETAISPKDDD
jgi:PAS domain S-box-containing protein